jgi:hypothetical protein
VIWPLLLSGAWAERAVGRARQGMHVWPELVYLAASRVCHQRPERSFSTAGVTWPICARCSGLYLAAPVGAVVAWRQRRRRAIGVADAGRVHRYRVWLTAAAVPTAATLGLEWLHLAPMTNGWRFAAALPLGAILAWALVDVAGAADSIE